MDRCGKKNNKPIYPPTPPTATRFCSDGRHARTKQAPRWPKTSRLETGSTAERNYFKKYFLDSKLENDGESPAWSEVAVCHIAIQTNQV